MRQQDEDIVIDLHEIFELIKKNVIRIAAVMVACGIIAGAITTYVIEPKYTSTSKIFILTNTQSIISVSDLQLGSWLAKDYEELIVSRPVLEKVIDNLDLDISHGRLLNMISIVNPENTRMVNIKITYNDPVIAMKIANELAEVSRKSIAEIMQVEEPVVVEKAIEAKGASSPSQKKNVVIGIILGALLSIGIILARSIMDNTIKNPDDIERYLGMNTLSVIPKKSQGKSGNRHKNRKGK